MSIIDILAEIIIIIVVVLAFVKPELVFKQKPNEPIEKYNKKISIFKICGIIVVIGFPLICIF